MLKMSRCLPVSGGHCPTVAPEFHPWGAHVDHGFDRDHHSFLKFRTGSPFSKIGNLRFFMQFLSNSMPHKFFDNAVIELSGIFLHFIPTATHTVHPYSLFNTPSQAFHGSVNTPP